MNAIPFLEQPELQEVLKYNNIPCYEVAKKVISEETEKGNKILLVGDAGCHPSETCVVIDFAERPKYFYEDLKEDTRANKRYPYLSYSDNKGALQIIFGRIEEND